MNNLNERRLLCIISILSFAFVLWLASVSTTGAVPRGIQEYTLTTTSDFAAGTALRTGLVNNNGGEVELVPVGVTGIWVTDTQQLPLPRMELATATDGNRIYALGGVDDSSLPQRTIYSTTVVGGALTKWVTQTNAFPIRLSGPNALIATAGGATRLYVLGGFDGFNVSNKVYYAALNSDGSVGIWITNSINLPVGVYFASSVVNRNYIYVIGGIDNLNAYRNIVYRAPFNNDGSVGAWTAVASLPQPIALSAAVVYNGSNADTIYVLGGATSSLTNTANVYFSDINPADGTLTSWTSSDGVLPQAFSSHAAVQANGQIYVIGGNSGGLVSSLQPRKLVLAALVDENNPTRRLFDFGGGQSSWVETEPLPVPRRLHGAALVSSQLFAIGGDSATGNSNSSPSTLTYHGPIGGVGARYAPSGIYVSPIINVGGSFQMLDLEWSTVITNQSALSVTLRYHTSTNGMDWFPYSGLLPSSSATSANLLDAKPITYPLNTIGQYFQYQVFFTTTLSSVTPFFTESHLRVLPPPPDLAVSKAAQAKQVLPGNLITYTIAYSNVNGSTAVGVILTESVPSNTTFVGADPGWLPAGNGLYTKLVGTLGPNNNAITHFVVRVNNPPLASSVANMVSIGGDPSETNFSNNSAGVNTIVQSLVNGVDLRVSLDDQLTYPIAGQVISYAVTYINFGDTAANGARLTETLPANMTYVGGPEWSNVGGNQYAHDIGTVASADSGGLNFVTLLDANVGGNTQLTNTVTIGLAGTDVNTANNTATDVDLVLPPNLSVTQDDGTAVLTPMQIVTYTILYQNVGGAAATSVMLTETLPLAVSVFNASGWTPAGGQYVRNLGTLAPGASGSATFAVQVNNNVSNGTLITNNVTILGGGENLSTLGDNSARDVDTVFVGGAPDLQISGASGALAVAGQPASVVVTVTNAGSAATPTWFFVDLYVDPSAPPTNRSQLGNNFTTNGDLLAPGEWRRLSIPWTFASAGSHTLYLQADTCDGSTDCLDPSYGRVAESNEANNIFGPLLVNVTATGATIYLPLIRR